jgi:hypothetical protein
MIFVSLTAANIGGAGPLYIVRRDHVLEKPAQGAITAARGVGFLRGKAELMLDGMRGPPDGPGLEIKTVR